MTDNTQELDVIFNKYTKQVIDMCHGNRPDVADESAKAKQAILDWHNKRELEARIDALEYAKISPKFKIEEKIEQLRLEAEL